MHTVKAALEELMTSMDRVDAQVIMSHVLGVNRAWIGIRFAGSSRYLHITVALMIPALGVAADAVIRRWRVFAVVA